MSAEQSPPRKPRREFTPAELRWLEDARRRHVPLSEPQAALIRRHFGPAARRRRSTAA